MPSNSRSQQPSQSSRHLPRPDRDEIIASQALETDEAEDLIIRIINYFLSLIPTKIPIKKADILKNVLVEKSKNFQFLFTVVKERLSEIYGYRIFEVRDKSAKQYICISQFPITFPSTLKRDDKKMHSLVFLIATYIFMKNNKVNESTLIEFLDEFNISFNNDHPYFGNVKKLITETFVKQLYLKKIKMSMEFSTEDVLTYSLGQRSEIEFPKKRLLQSVADLLNKPARAFIMQYEMVNNDIGGSQDSD